MKNYDEITNNLLSRRDEFVKTRKKRTKIITSVSLCAVVLVSALSVGLTRGGVFETKNSQSNINSNNSETTSQNKKVIYVTGDENDVGKGDGSLDNAAPIGKDTYLSPELEAKMDFYKDCKDDKSRLRQ